VWNQRAKPAGETSRETRIDEAYRLADQGHFAEAARHCEVDLRAAGPSARAFYLLGLVRDASGNASDAETFYRKAIYLDPGHREALVHLALLMDREGRPDDAQVLRTRVRRLEAANGA
jgi:chemotaxis protein methyltransferase WspC